MTAAHGMISKPAFISNVRKVDGQTRIPDQSSSNVTPFWINNSMLGCGNAEIAILFARVSAVPDTQ
jgi:hypothetical protein